MSAGKSETVLVERFGTDRKTKLRYIPKDADRIKVYGEQFIRTDRKLRDSVAVFEREQTA